MPRLVERPDGDRTRLEGGRERADTAQRRRPRAACNLDLKNPHAGEEIDPRPPEEIVNSIRQKERRILAIMEEIKSTLAEQP